MRISALVLFVSLASLAPSIAHAGGCTPCETSAECVDALGDPAFCIVWTDGTAACPGGPVPERGCCPGQGCATFSGRPSCEGEGRCVVVEDVDAGSAGTDAGGTGIDSGISGIDGGGTTTDSGGTGMDAGSGRDAGGTTTSAGGCACRAQGGPSGGAAALLGLVMLGLCARRRRR